MKRGRKLNSKETMWNKCIPEPNSGCWLWLGFCDRYGYGLVSYKDVNWLAHRLSYYLHVGEIPYGLILCHRCDQPSCINPTHMFLGTHKDNSDDKWSKGRQGKPGRPKKHPLA